MTITANAEDYLEAIHRLERAKSPVSTSALAERLGVSPASATQMMRNLSEQGLADYSPYQGIALTQAGRERALGLLRRHRLWERFLFDRLEIGWAEVHDEACRLEHATSEAVEERLAEMLGEPEFCPHGHPVPTAGGITEEEPLLSLASLNPRQKGAIVQVPEGERELLQYLSELKLVPESVVEMERKSSLGGPLMVKVEGVSQALDREVADQIMVRPI
jgi:DtxR family Mn-dependent transcriptional regulator